MFTEVVVRLLFGWLFLLTLLIRGVYILLRRYWYVWLGVLLFAIWFYHFNPNLGEEAVSVPPTEEPVIDWNSYEGWNCRWYGTIGIINGYSVDAEKCIQGVFLRARLFVGKDVLAEERYMSGVFLAGMINQDLLAKLKTKKTAEPTRSKVHEQMYRTDI